MFYAPQARNQFQRVTPAFQDRKELRIPAVSQKSPNPVQPHTRKGNRHPKNQYNCTQQAQCESYNKTVPDIREEKAHNVKIGLTYQPMNPYSRACRERPRNLNAESPSKYWVSGRAEPARSRFNHPPAMGLRSKSEDLGSICVGKDAVVESAQC